MEGLLSTGPTQSSLSTVKAPKAGVFKWAAHPPNIGQPWAPRPQTMESKDLPTYKSLMSASSGDTKTFFFDTIYNFFFSLENRVFFLNSIDLNIEKKLP